MFKLWVFVLIGLVQVAVVLSFIFPDDDYFKEKNPTSVPIYATDSSKPTPTRYYTTTTWKPTPTPRYTTTSKVRRFSRHTTTTRRTTTRRRTTTTATSNINDIDIDIAIFNSCMESCPVTTEYDPVCGNDGDTYPNKSTLGCIRRCGIDVEMVRLGRC